MICLFNFIIFLILFIIILYLTFLSMRSFRLRKTIRQLLKQELRGARHELAHWEHHPVQQFEILKPLYNAASFSVGRMFSVDQTRVDDLIDRELNRLIKGMGARLASLFELALVGLVAGVLMLTSVFQGIMVLEQYQKTSFQLDFSAVSQWLDGSEEADATPRMSIPKSAVGLTPQAKTYSLPSRITTSKEMGQAFAYYMSRHESEFQIQYTGDTRRFTEVGEQAWEWLQRNEPYLMRLYKDSDGQGMDYGSYVMYTMTLDYTLSKDQTDRVEKKVKQIVQKIPKNWSDYKKVRYINDYIVRQTAYKLKSKESPYTPYSILFNREGVCEGYALTAYLLLQAADVEVRYISGKAGGGLHAWNLVKLKGNWYHLDTTWNDPVPNRPDEVQEDYLLVSDDTLRKDHSWNAKKYPQTAKVDY